MTEFLFTYRSLTLAQKALHRLRRAGIDAAVRKAPAELSAAGCSNAVSVRGMSPDFAVSVLESSGAPPMKVYMAASDGTLTRWLS